MKRLRTKVTRKKKVFELSDTFTFGKYKDTDLTLADVINDNIGYITWCIEEVEFFEMDNEAFEYYEDCITRLVPDKKKEGFRTYRDNYHVIPSVFADRALERIFHNSEVDDLNDEPFFGPEEVFGPNGSDNGWGHGL